MSVINSLKVAVSIACVFCLFNSFITPQVICPTDCQAWTNQYKTVKTTSTMSTRNCCVVGCTNGGKKLRKWKTLLCEVHQCNFGTSRCICDPPFTLIPFPTESVTGSLNSRGPSLRSGRMQYSKETNT